jgi:hypothetical protein
MASSPSKTVGLVLLASLASAAATLALAPRPQTTGGGQSDPPDVTPTATFPALATSDSNDRMIAVTGIDMTGTSILYVIDTDTRQLAVYQANGGAPSMQSLKLVGARRIDLDLQLYGYNDESEYSFEELQEEFARRRAGTPPPVK